jgi:ABC-2 type transport system permease protein
MATIEGGIGAEHLLAVFVGLSLHAMGLASLGLACSAFSSSQLVAAVASWALGFVLWDFAWAGPLLGERSGPLLDALSMHPRYGSFAEGIVNLEHVAYFVGLAGVCAALAHFSFDWRRVSGA